MESLGKNDQPFQNDTILPNFQTIMFYPMFLCHVKLQRSNIQYMCVYIYIYNLAGSRRRQQFEAKGSLKSLPNMERLGCLFLFKEKVVTSLLTNLFAF